MLISASLAPGPYCFCAAAGVAAQMSASATSAPQVEPFLPVILHPPCSGEAYTALAPFAGLIVSASILQHDTSNHFPRPQRLDPFLDVVHRLFPHRRGLDLTGARQRPQLTRFTQWT